MSILRILQVGVGAALVGGIAHAQFPPIRYSNHWQPNAEIVGAVFSGPALFSLAGAPNFAGPGDAIRRCYDEAQTQGGRNQSAGVWESTNYSVIQAFAQGGPGVDIGLVSVQAGSESDLGGDVCFSPFLASAGNTGGHKLGAAMVPGVVTGTSAYPFPYVFEVVFQWTGTTTAAPSFQGVGNRATDGTAGASAGVSNPLLVNVIYEIQGPLTGGPLNNQYFCGSTAEVTGLGGGSTALGQPASSATGGVTNGNSAWGSSIFGADAAVSGAVSHSRLLATTPAGLIASIPRPLGGSDAPLELIGFVGFQSPGLWAINDGNEGAGGPDWRISTSPVSVVNLRAQDHLAGAQTNANILFKAGGSGPADPAFDPTLVFNQPLFLFSTTPAATMQQSPFSWDDLGGTAAAQPGSILLGPQPTRREGQQTVPIDFDAISAAFLECVNLTLGQQYIGSDDLFVLAPFGVLAGTSSYFEGAFDNGYAVASPTFPSNQNIVSGTSRFSGPGLGDVPVAGQAKPAAAGVRIGVVAVGVQVRSTSPAIALTELSSALTIVLQ